MNLRYYIELGILTKGSVTNLANALGVAPNNLTNAKAHTRGLPLVACFKLAEIIGHDVRAVIAASELVCEKNAERRGYWLNFLNPVMPTKSALFGLAGLLVTNFVTPSPAEASQNQAVTAQSFCIMSNSESNSSGSICRRPIYWSKSRCEV